MTRSTRISQPKTDRKTKSTRPEKQCANCEYFLRHHGLCLLREEQTTAALSCPGHVFRQACRVCGCSHYDPCEEGCWWVESDLCSACARRPEGER